MRAAAAELGRWGAAIGIAAGVLLVAAAASAQSNGALGVSPYARGSTQRSETAQAAPSTTRGVRPTEASPAPSPEQAESPTVGTERGVGGSRTNTTGQSDFSDNSMGVDIQPGAGGSRSDMSGQPDYTDNEMGFDSPPPGLDDEDVERPRAGVNRGGPDVQSGFDADRNGVEEQSPFDDDELHAEAPSARLGPPDVDGNQTGLSRQPDAVERSEELGARPS